MENEELLRTRDSIRKAMGISLTPYPKKKRKLGEFYQVSFIFEMVVFGFELLWPRCRPLFKVVGWEAEAEELILHILHGGWDGPIQARVAYVACIVLTLWIGFYRFFTDLVFGIPLWWVQIHWTMVSILIEHIFDLDLHVRNSFVSWIQAAVL